MPGQQRPRPQLAEVKIDGRQVMEALHTKYTEFIAQLMHANAELTVGFETAQAEIAQLRAHNTALQQQLGVTKVNVATPASAGQAEAAG